MNKVVIRSQNKQKDNRNRADKKQCIHKVGSQKEDFLQQKLFSRTCFGVLQPSYNTKS